MLAIKLTRRRGFPGREGKMRWFEEEETEMPLKAGKI